MATQERYRQTRRFDDYRDPRRRDYEDPYRDGYAGDYRDGRRDDYRGMPRDDAYRDVRRDFYEYDDPRGRGGYDQDGPFYGRGGYDRGPRSRGDEYFEGEDPAGAKEQDEAASSFDEGGEEYEPDAREDRRGRVNDRRREESYYRDDRYESGYDNPGGTRPDRGRDSYSESFQSQMDAFRDKAKQLQEIINDKQDRVDYLERSLADVNERNRILEEELMRSRQETGDAAADIEEQVNRLSEMLGRDIEGMEQRIADHISEIPVNLPGEMQEITIDTESINRSFDEQSKRMEDVFSSISEKLEEIIDLQKNAGKQSFDEVFSDQKSFLSNAMLTHEKKISDSLNGVGRQVEGMKDELSEKIHSEDVKVYRNIQDFIQEQDHFDEAKKDVNTKYKKSTVRDVLIIGLTIIDIILGVIFLGVIM